MTSIRRRGLPTIIAVISDTMTGKQQPLRYRINTMERRSHRSITQNILLTEWDPIGVSGIPEAKDEYDAYADTVSGMMATQTASANAISRYLYQVATEHMGLSYPELEERCHKAAKAIVELQ